MLLKRKVDIETAKADIEGVNALHKTAQNKSADRYITKSDSSLYIAQVKQQHGIIEREKDNKPKSGDARQPQCPPEKERAITEARKHFGMISLTT